MCLCGKLLPKWNNSCCLVPLSDYCTTKETSTNEAEHKKSVSFLNLVCLCIVDTDPPPLPTPQFFLILPLHVEKKRASFLSALVQDTFACQMLCPQSTCNLIARRTTIIEDKDADCGVTDGLLHQDLNCQLSYCTTGPKQITVNCPRVNCRLVETHRVTWLI